MMRNRIRKTAVFFAAFFLIAGNLFLSVGATGLPDGINTSKVSAFLLYNVENDCVIAQDNSSAVIAPGATVKIMTGLIFCEKLSDRFDEKIKVTKDMTDGFMGRYAGIKEGETPTIRDLMYMSLCGCYADAIKILEIYIAGTELNFIAMMNNRAKELGMLSTNYANATGLDVSGMITTVNDLLILAKEASRNQLYMSLTSCLSYTTEGLKKEFQFPNYNLLFSSGQYRNQMCSGMSSGNTEAAGYTLVTCAEKNGLSYICIVMGGVIDEYNNIYSYITANKLLNWAFDSFGYVDVVKSSDVICELPVNLSFEINSVLVVPENTVTLFLPLDTVIGKDITYSYILSYESIDAPFREKTQVGFLSLYRGEEKLGTVSLVTKSSVSRNELLSWLQKIKNMTKSTFFIATVISACAITLLYVIINSFIRARKSDNKRKKYR